MKLSDLSIQVRQRSTWESIDLGFALVQQHWRSLMLPYSLLLSLIAIIVWLVTPERYLWLAGFIVWWFKPLYDRLLLYILSRQLFSETVTTAQAFSALPSLIANTSLFGALTYRRFSFSRSYSLPIWQLEGLRGKELKERRSLIYLQGHSQAVWLTVGCVHLEWIVLFSLYMLILMFDPTGAAWEHIKSLFRGDVDMDTDYWRTLLDFVFLLIAILLIEPFYVAAGFMLYINRRTQLEAWDIEIAFRNLGERLANLAKTGTGLLPSLFMLFLTSALYATSSLPVQAQYAEARHETLAPEQSAAKIQEVMALEELNNRRKIKTWQARDPKVKADKSPKLSESVIQLISTFLKTVLWIAVIVGIALALIYHKKILALLGASRLKQKPKVAPDVLFGLDIRPESLPDDIAGAARELWQQGYTREALSLLYRGALVILTHGMQLEVHASHTEGDILKLSKPVLDTEHFNYLRQLTRHWQTIAYAHRTPSNEELEPLFAGWSEFQQPPAKLALAEVSA
jgi:hypothetical protein